jgi:hypothetical protein
MRLGQRTAPPPSFHLPAECGHRPGQPDVDDGQRGLDRVPARGAQAPPHQPFAQIAGHLKRSKTASAGAAPRLGRRATTAVNVAWAKRFDTGAERAAPLTIMSRAIARAFPLLQNTL